MLAIETLKRALEGRDNRALSEFYADDATLIVMSKDSPPRSPRTISGRTAISAYYDEVCRRDMKHELVAGVADDSHLAFTEACAYPDGTRVFCSAMAELLEGKIKRQTNVQVWDA
ncbi:nuclear transport factor 2 family protein [Roseomonas sp. M0104]|uniref:Nuclear transport factor 2 family protein n=1 Tax=Teichococcus coralli TaxID=2545983 RepID=A0A845B9Y7_9PROT|nr:nuclear transport factor 2 family protein [Pseudoroseomonas coralli]MXP62990.1 nuclear transport factor 2 family protein [Pseudoroseomonas coralli]